MARKQRQSYPTRKVKGGGAPAREPIIPPSLAVIDTTAGIGRKGLAPGARVTIRGGGLYAGERAVIEKLVAGVIPAALVRTEAGRTRQVRTIDLEPIAPGSEQRAEDRPEA
ncbi:MAG: hypothetical protein RL338_1283 [Chloroflexota bacterium]|jgi:hypothetical protein